MRAHALVKATKNKRGARDSNPVKSEEQATVYSCVKCGKSFSELVELTVRAEGSLETYHACPHCFSRISLPHNSEKGLHKVPLNVLGDASKHIEKNRPVGCAHFLGYLKNRPEGSPIPEECLTCVSVVQCMGLSRQP